MSAHSSDNATHSTTTIPNWNRLPCVQYGFADNCRNTTLHTIFEPIPDDAVTASPVYLLSREQFEWHRDLDNPYRVKNFKMVATKLQTQCEENQNVLYPIHIESDAYPEEGPETLIEWFREFTEDHLDTPFHTCTLYFSGRRSIHVHVPRFVSGEADRKHLKALAEVFCEETGADLDCGLYGRKRMFRLPGVQHAKTGLHKVEIQPDWSHTRIVREATKPPGLPESYAAILQHVYVSQQPLTVESEWGCRKYPLLVFRVLNSDKTIIEFDPDSQPVETSLIERRTLPEDATFEEKTRWWMYNAKEFSPYALAEGGSRSVAALKVKGTPFARQEETGGTYNQPIHALVPAYFYGARGCAGEEYTKERVHAPLQLSKPDYEKWSAEPGDYVVIIGGNSGNSIIHDVDSWQARVVGHALTGEDASRKAALDYLEEEGYHIGSAGKTAPKWEPDSARRHRRASPHSRRSQPSEAKLLERKAEREGIQTLTHTELHQVACRQLKFGWKLAWDWFKTQFGPDFDPQITRQEFRIVLTVYPEDYSHVQDPRRAR